MGCCDSVEDGRKKARENGRETVVICDFHRKDLRWASPAVIPSTVNALGKIYYSGLV